MPTAYLGLGSNLGDRQAHIAETVSRLRDTPGIESIRVSRTIETAPVGGPRGQAAYLNAAAQVDTSLGPRALLAVMQHIEAALGRERTGPNAPRTIDVDLLLYGDCVIDEPGLRVPHSRMAWRRFVLEPLAELAPEAHHPELDRTAAELLANLRRRPPYVAIAGPIGVGKTTLARLVGERSGARVVLERLSESLGLAAFYRDRSGHAEATQEAFLRMRAELLDPRQFRDEPERWVVSDFVMQQGALFAGLTLDIAARRRYDQQERALTAGVIQPTFVVLMDAEPDTLIERIQRRGRPFESDLDAEYLRQVCDAYRHVRDWLPGVPVLRVDTGDPESVSDRVIRAMQSVTA